VYDWKKIPRPWNTDTLRAYYDHLHQARYAAFGNRPASPDQLRYVNAGLTKLRAVTCDFDRYVILLGLFGHCGNISRTEPSSSQLEMAQASFIIDWIGANEKNDYTPSEHAQQEAFDVLRQGMIEWGQLELMAV
jgi:hypothetical protein